MSHTKWNAISTKSPPRILRWRCGFRFGFLALWISSFATFALAADDLLTELMKETAFGPPALEGQLQGPSSYEKFTATKLRNPKVTWVNRAWFVEHGIMLPDPLTPEIEKVISDAFAYMVPSPQDPPDAFISELKKTLYADRYGGTGIGFNFGSGRAGSYGIFQTKGSGVSPLVSQYQSFDHGHGGASLEESIREAVWGEVFHRELPYGGNRVIAIIDTGTYTRWKDAGKERRALIIREDPLRPAHYMKNSNEQTIFDNQRMKENMELLKKNWKKAGFSNAKDFSGFMEEYVERLAKQYAAAFAKKYFHGAPSQSNIELSLKFLDYGTATAQPGYGNIKVLSHIDPSGETSQIKSRLITEFTRGIAPESKEKLLALFDQSYAQDLGDEFLKLTGVPEPIRKGLNGTPEEQALASELIKLTRVPDPSDGINVDKIMPKETHRSDLGKILSELGQSNWDDGVLLESKLEKYGLSEGKAKDFRKAYQNYFQKVQKEAGLRGIQPENLRTFVSESALRLNAQSPELYRPDLMKNNIQWIDQYVQSGSAPMISKHVDDVLEASRHWFVTDDPFQLVLKEKKLGELASIQEIFDAKSGKRSLVLSGRELNGKIWISGNEIPVQEFQSSVMRYTLDGWKDGKYFETPIRKHASGRFSFEIPLSSGASPGPIEMVVRNQSGTKYWKQAEGNFTFQETISQHSGIGKLPCSAAGAAKVLGIGGR